MKDKITKALERASGLETENINVAVPEREEHGDYTSNIAMIIFSNDHLSNSNFKKKLNNNLTIEQYNNPLQLAEEIVKLLKKDKDLTSIVDKIQVAGPGFINFYIKKEALMHKMQNVIEKKDLYGNNESLKDRKIMVEYAHPNTHKQFHIGHMRNISTGEAISRILEACGAKIIRTNYQGDVGMHVAKALWGVKKLGKDKDVESKNPYEKAEYLGEAYALGSKAYEEDEKAKAEIMKMNVQIYQKSEEVIPLWDRTRKWSLEYFDAIYKRVGTKFDRLYMESEVAELGKNIAEEALEKGILEESEGAVVFKGDEYGLDTRVFLTGEDLPTYEAKELGLAKLEFGEFGELDKCLHIVAPEQTSFFKVTFKVEELLDPERYKGKQKHVRYGFVQLKEGKMSSRLGQVVTGPWLLDEAKRRAGKLIKEGAVDENQKNEIAEKVAVGAVKYSMLLPGTDKDIRFDINESVALEGNSGPYLQYTYARTNSVLRKAKPKNKKTKKLKNDIQVNNEELLLLRSFIHFPEVVREAGEKYSPNLLCNYLFDVAQKFNTFYNAHRIIGPESERAGEQEFRIALTEATGTIIKNGLTLLGIKAPEKM